MEINFPISYTITDESDLAEIKRIVSCLPIEFNTKYLVNVISKRADPTMRGSDLVLLIDSVGERFNTAAYVKLEDEMNEITEGFLEKSNRLDQATLDEIVKVKSADFVIENIGGSRFLAYFDGTDLYRVQILLH